MLFPTFEFLFLFLPLVFFLHESKLFKEIRWQLILLTLASIVFVSFWEMRSLYVIVGMLIANLFVLKRLAAEKSRFWFIMGILVNLLPLFYFKYTAFVLGNIGIELTLQEKKALKIVTLPLAISFYSFVALTYVVDLYKRKFENHSPLNYSFFVTFFPHLIAGPIVHHSDLIPQIGIKKDRPALFFEGLLYLIIGFCKKIFIADPLGGLVDAVYVSIPEAVSLSFADALTATIGYTLQLYFDFSGYSDMAIGLGLFFGYRLPINFNSPYLSTSITDFWRRWHMTLSRLMREYVYFSLGGSKRGETRTFVNILATMLVSGIWHGAGWTFVFWGFLHGVAMCIEKATGLIAGPFIAARMPKGVKIISTFAIVNLLWVLFRAEDIDTAFAVYSGLFLFDSFGIFSSTWIFLVIPSLLLLFMPNSHRIAEFATSRFQQLSPAVWRFAVGSSPGFILGLCLCLTSLYVFYSTTIDRICYASLPIERYQNGVDNKEGDFRSNIFSSGIFTHDGPKMVIVGSSYTTSMGNYSFEHERQKVYSTTLGTGGNNLHVGLRGALAVLDTENLEVLVMGVSPLNMGPIIKTGPFETQLYGRFDLLGINLRPNRYSEAFPVKLSFIDTIRLLGKEKHRFQFREFLFKIATATGLASFESDAWKKHTDWLEHQPIPVGKKLSSYLATIPPSGIPPQNVTNGSNETFLWNNRGALESISPEGDAYRAISALSGLCKENGIRFVLYSTPTVTHTDAPHIYPEKFLENYQEKMLLLARQEHIEYYDFSDAVPWDSAYMGDFIHPTSETRRLIHKHLINLVFGKSS